jgi:hypothetical protein
MFVLEEHQSLTTSTTYPLYEQLPPLKSCITVIMIALALRVRNLPAVILTCNNA